MEWVTGIVVYLLVWWTTIFMILPIGAQPPSQPETGHSPSAPAHPQLVKKFLANTVVAAIIWAGIDLGIRLELVDFWVWANQIPR